MIAEQHFHMFGCVCFHCHCGKYYGKILLREEKCIRRVHVYVMGDIECILPANPEVTGEE